MTATFALLLTCCQFSADFTLPFSLAAVFAYAIHVVMECTAVSMLISGFLRLITIVRKSEEAGLQLLGSDDQAIVIIRAISVLLSFGVILVANVAFKAQVPSIDVLTGAENVSMTTAMSTNPYAATYFVLPYLAAAVNLVTILVSPFHVNKFNDI